MTAGRRWLMCSSFGNWSALQRDYGDYGGDTEAIWHARRRRSQASVVDSNKAKVDYEIICFQNFRSEFPRCVNEGPGPHCSRKKKNRRAEARLFFRRVRFGGLLERWRFVARLAALGLAGRQENDVRPIVGHQPPTFPSPSRPRSSSPISSELEILPPCP